MGSLSLWHWLIVLAIVVILFGRGRISGIMGDLGRGITSFRRSLREVESDTAEIDRAAQALVKNETTMSGGQRT